MTIIEVEESKEGRYLAPFLINYSKEDADYIHELWEKYDMGYITDCLGGDQGLAEEVYRIHKKKSKHFKDVNAIKISYDDYEKGTWKIYCKSDLYPRKYYEDQGKSFFNDYSSWIHTSDKMPEQVLEKIKNKDYHPEAWSSNFNDLHFMTEPVLIHTKDGKVDIDSRRKFDSDDKWIWDKYEGSTDIDAWMKIPKYDKH